MFINTTEAWHIVVSDFLDNLTNKVKLSKSDIQSMDKMDIINSINLSETDYYKFMQYQINLFLCSDDTFYDDEIIKENELPFNNLIQILLSACFFVNKDIIAETFNALYEIIYLKLYESVRPSEDILNGDTGLTYATYENGSLITDNASQLLLIKLYNIYINHIQTLIDIWESPITDDSVKTNLREILSHLSNITSRC